jgi:hypothetical protein
MNNTHRRIAVACASLITALALSGCSDGGLAVPPGGATSTGTAIPGGTGAAASVSASTGAVSQTSMRVVNLFSRKKAAGPALDIYDVQLTGQKAIPVATNVGYGAVSAYFTPHLEPNSSSIVQLYALPAGEDPVADISDAQYIGGAQDDGSHPQITWVLTADTGTTLTGPLAGLSFSSKVEKGTNNGGKAPVAPPAPSGDGEIMADTAAVSGTNAELFLLIDGSCDPALNGDTALGHVPYIFSVDGKAPVSSFALFATAPGSHQVSVVSWTELTVPTCAQLSARQGTTSVDVTDGEQIEAYVYGTSDTDLHLALAPVKQ